MEPKTLLDSDVLSRTNAKDPHGNQQGSSLFGRSPAIDHFVNNAIRDSSRIESEASNDSADRVRFVLQEQRGVADY